MRDKDFVIRNKIFSDPSDYLNKVKFNTYVPKHVFNIDSKIESGEIHLPWIDEIDPNELVRSSFTIAELLNFYNKKIIFKICEKLDILKVYKYINMYLYNVEILIKNNDITKEHQEYFKILSNFKTCIEEILLRLAKVDPGIADRLNIEKFKFNKLINELC